MMTMNNPSQAPSRITDAELGYILSRTTIGINLAEQEQLCAEIKRLCQVEKDLQALMFQLKDSGWKDSLGHTIEMNQVYQQILAGQKGGPGA